LIDGGADLQAQDDYALRWAAENGHLAVVEYLVNQGANIHAQDDYALRMAMKHEHLDVVEYLINRGAERLLEISETGDHVHLQTDFINQYMYTQRLAVENRDFFVVEYLEDLIEQDTPAE
jgi:ankyrin repeat protein